MAIALAGSMHEALVTTLLGLGYRLVDMQLSPRYGLIRLFIERCAPRTRAGEALDIQPLWAHLPQDVLTGEDAHEGQMSAENRAINGEVGVEDCALVSNHVSRWFMAEDIDYQRLEVSSPGIDRRLSTADDFIRFAGMPVVIELKHAVPNPREGAAPQRRFRGRLASAQTDARVEFMCDGQTFFCQIEDIDEARIDEETWLADQAAQKRGRKATPRQKPAKRQSRKAAAPLAQAS